MVQIVKASIKDSGGNVITTFEGVLANLAVNVPAGGSYTILTSVTRPDSIDASERETVVAQMYDSGGNPAGTYSGSATQLAANTFSGGSTGSPVPAEPERVFAEEQPPVRMAVYDASDNFLYVVEASPRQISKNTPIGGRTEWV